MEQKTGDLLSSTGGEKCLPPLQPPDESTKRKALVEALLFVAGEPVTAGSIAKVTGLEDSEIRVHVADLSREYRERDAGVVIAEIAEGYLMMTHSEFGVWVRRFKNISTSGKLSQPSLETLSIIAYKQPITKVEVDQLRGVNSEGALRTLLERRLIKIIGKKESPGRPFLYGTTREFLQYFGLGSLSDLPPLSDSFRDEAA